MRTHVTVLAWLHIVFGVLGLLAGLAALVFFGGLAGIISFTDADPDARVGSLIMGGIGGLAFLVCLLLSLPALIAGAGLLKFRPWARVLTIILSVINILNVPIGTALGVYGLWVLFSQEGAALFAEPHGAMPPPAPWQPR
jgi:hypothetical protein